MWRSSVVLLFVAIVGCTDDGFVGEATVSGNTRTTASADAPLTLERARQLLERRTASAVGPVTLNGYNFHREVEIGNGLRVIVISRNLGGGLLVFDANGANVSAKQTKEITWVQLFDLDEDGVAEVVTEEIEGRGTGVLEKRFHIYRFAANGIESVWTGESYSRHAPTPEAIEETTSFIRFDMSGAGRSARLTHLVFDVAGRRREATFEWRDGGLQAVR
jgi:hypothetical protein